MDSGNRGCEGIYRGTEKILEKNKIAAYSSNIELDKKMGLSVEKRNMLVLRKMRNNFYMILLMKRRVLFYQQVEMSFAMTIIGLYISMNI